MSNVVVNFVVTTGGGSVVGEAEATNAQGYADEQWTLGPRLGPQTLSVRTINASTGVVDTSQTFTATGLLPNNVPVVGSNSVGIFMMNADGSGFKQVTTGGMDFEPDLSSDHTRITFFSTRTADSAAVYLMNVNGGNIHPVTTTMNAEVGSPAFSPDDSLILYTGQPTSAMCVLCNIQITVVDTAGVLVSNFQNAGGDNGPASWTTDGRRIIFRIELGRPHA